MAVSGSGLMGFLGWCWGKPMEIVVSRGLELMGTEGKAGFCKLCIAGSGGMVIASSAMLVVDCSSEDGLLRV